MIYNFQVISRLISAEDKAFIADNTSDTAAFSFDSEWDGLVKTARFQQGTSYTDVILSDNTCGIPKLSTGTFYVGVYAGDLHTSAPCSLTAEQSILSSGGIPAAPTEDVYAQLMNYIGETYGEFEEAVTASQALQEAASTAQNAANGAQAALFEVQQALAEATASLSTKTESFTALASTWLTGMISPFAKMHDVTVISSIGEDSIVSLGGISAEAQATYGIVIGGVTGQTVRLYCMTEPAVDISGKIIITG